MNCILTHQRYQVSISQITKRPVDDDGIVLDLLLLSDGINEWSVPCNNTGFFIPHIYF